MIKRNIPRENDSLTSWEIPTLHIPFCVLSTEFKFQHLNVSVSIDSPPEEKKAPYVKMHKTLCSEYDSFLLT